jgi:hypothetical protein
MRFIVSSTHSDVFSATRRYRRAVHHLLVRRRAQGRRIAAISLECRLGASRAHARLRRRIQIPGRHTRRHHSRELVENPRDELVGRAHLLQFRR